MNYTTSGRHEPRPIRFVARPEGAGGDDKSGRAQSACREATCVNASRELQAQSKPSRFNRDSDFAAPPVLVYRPKGSAGEGCVSFAGQLPQVHRKAVGKMRARDEDEG